MSIFTPVFKIAFDLFYNFAYQAFCVASPSGIGLAPLFHPFMEASKTMADNTTHDAVLDEMESHSPENLHPILEAAYKYRVQLVIGVSVIIGMAALYAGITTYNKRALNTAQTNLGAILVQNTGQDRLDKLEELLSMAPSNAKPAIQLEIAQTSMQLGQYDKAAESWGLLIGETDNDMQLVARLGKSKSLLLAGKANEAVVELKDLAGIAPEAFTVPVYRQLALAAETAGDTAQALSAYRKLAENPITDKPFVEYKISQLEAK